jgi:hypothetical protein
MEKIKRNNIVDIRWFRRSYSSLEGGTLGKIFRFWRYSLSFFHHSQTRLGIVVTKKRQWKVSAFIWKLVLNITIWGEGSYERNLHPWRIILIFELDRDIHETILCAKFQLNRISFSRVIVVTAWRTHWPFLECTHFSSTQKRRKTKNFWKIYNEYGTCN